MKNIIFAIAVVMGTSPLVWGQTASSALDQAIEQQVLQQQTAPQDSTRPAGTTAAQRRVQADAADPRIVYLNGRTYQLRQKNRFMNNGRFDTHTYVSNASDTMIVNFANANYDIVRPAAVPKGFTVTSQEELANSSERQSTITACERRNPDGSCEYIVKRTDRTIHYNTPASTVPGHFNKGTVTVRQTFAPGANTDSLKANTYQSLRNTNVMQTFGGNLNRGGPNDIYGPESYAR